MNNIWKPSLAIVGADGLPPSAIGGNVLRPETVIKLSVRLPPTKNANEAAEWLKKTLESNPPYGADVKFDGVIAMSGWNAPVNH